MALTLEEFGIDRLNGAEKRELLDLLWDHVVADPDFTIPNWHREELERRIAVADANPDAGEPWETVRARLLERP
jgi:putative addiction module component (TIGR02574 family)